jgi:hypothetical protein
MVCRLICPPQALLAARSEEVHELSYATGFSSQVVTISVNQLSHVLSSSAVKWFPLGFLCSLVQAQASEDLVMQIAMEY